MSEDQATQTSEQEATQTGDAAATEQIQSQRTGEESNAQATESIEQWQKRHSEASAKIAQQGEQMAALRAQQEALNQQLEMQQRANMELLGQARQQVQPKDAAFETWQEALYAGDTVKANAAWGQYEQLKEAELEQRLLNKAIQQQRMMNELPQAGQMLGVQDQNALSHQLQNVATSLTPTELALVQLNRAGKLSDHVASQNAAQEAARQQADALKALPGMGGGKGVPGAAHAGGGQPWIEFAEFASGTPQAQLELVEGDQNVTIVGAPQGWKPPSVADLKRQIKENTR